jgi:hypothetical protein
MRKSDPNSVKNRRSNSLDDSKAFRAHILKKAASNVNLVVKENRVNSLLEQRKKK